MASGSVRGAAEEAERPPADQQRRVPEERQAQGAKPAKQNGDAEGGPPAEVKTPPTAPHRKHSTGEQQELQRAPEEPPPPPPPPRRNFQIPRKTREKKALFQPIVSGSREFEDILKILHSSYLEQNSVANFNYKKASLVHSELLEKEFTERRRELKSEGRLDKELVETYAFLLVDRAQVQNVCEKGLNVGHSKVTILGNPNMGVYLSKFADLLQPNPLDPGATGDVIIFKILKGKMKSIFDQPGKSQLDSAANKRFMDPTPKHECHVSKSASRVNSLLAYRAYEFTQYYLYEYFFDEIRRRPRHVCPYAVVSFGYKDEMSPITKAIGSTRSNSFNMERNLEHLNYTLWRGQILNKGKVLCHAYMKSATRPFLPFKLSDKLDVEMAMSIENLKKKVPAILICKDTYSGYKEVYRFGLYCSLYEVMERSRTGSNVESLLQKLEKEKIVLVKPLGDKGFLFLLSPLQMASPYESQIGKMRVLHALFIFQESRGVNNLAPKCPPIQENHETLPEITEFLRPLHYALLQSRKDTSADFNAIIEKHAREYLKRRVLFGASFHELNLFQYDLRLDEKTFLYGVPKNKPNLYSSLQNYIFGPHAYVFEVQKAKEILKENHKQQFSPISDYEAVEEEADHPKTERNNGPNYDIPVVPDGNSAGHRKSSQSSDYDQDKLKDLISLIQCRKLVEDEPETVGNENAAGLKRKLESEIKLENDTENVRKIIKSEDMEIEGHYEGHSNTESQSVLKLLTGFGGQDSDMRPQDITAPAVPDSHGLIKLLLETLAGAGHLDASLAQSVNQALGLQGEAPNVAMERHQDYVPITTQTLVKQEQTLQVDHVPFKEPFSQEHMVTDFPYSYPGDVDFRVKANESNSENTIRMHDEQRAESISSFDGNSPCPSTPVEHPYRRQYSSSTSLDSEVHWKLIPITGMKSPEDLAYFPPTDTLPNDPRLLTRMRSSDYDFPYSHILDLQKMRNNKLLNDQEEEIELHSFIAQDHMFENKHSQGGIIENAVLEEYNNFTRKIHQLLRQKNIDYISNPSIPCLSMHERVPKLSAHLHLQTSQICVQNYVDSLHQKLNSIVSSLSSYHRPIQCNNSMPAPEHDLAIETTLFLPAAEEMQTAPNSNLNGSFVLGQACEDTSKYTVCREQHSVMPSNYYKGLDDQAPVLPMDQLSTSGSPQESAQTTPNVTTNANISTAQPALSDLINKLKPEVFNSLVKIIEDVQKNTVKFYIHSEEENTVCTEIKEYLTKLGNTACNPDQFLETKAALDKLLIIIQNEDIASSIHKIPALVTLKKQSCVSFAGVDSLNDVKNHTYHELFESGGFVVSDESVLDPETVTVDKLNDFLKFLEGLNSPDAKWEWKIHCKIQKKLKELGRTNAKALSVLTLLNAYQKKHLVEILPYHSCDSQTRNAPELDCLIRLQSQNIKQRHAVFLTAKDVKMFSAYGSNGIIVTAIEEFMQNFVNLIGHHNLTVEENCLAQLAAEHQASQPVPTERDDNDGDDMSLDSGDEIPHIEVCSRPSAEEAFMSQSSQSHGTDLISSQREARLTIKTEGDLT